MAITLEALEVDVLRLPLADRSRLLDGLIKSLDDEATLDQTWDSEAARRDEEIERGASAPVGGREVVARLRASLA
jgi:hypothetical protein